MNAAKEECSVLAELSAEHDFVLQICARIREGLMRNVPTYRIRNYAEWVRENYLKPHFEIEEQYVFPLLGSNLRVKRALANHRRINRLLSCSCEDIKVLNLLEEELSAHVRFEERILYREIRQMAANERLSEIEKNHAGICFDDSAWEDRFWDVKLSAGRILKPADS